MSHQYPGVGVVVLAVKVTGWVGVPSACSAPGGLVVPPPMCRAAVEVNLISTPGWMVRVVTPSALSVPCTVTVPVMV